MPSMCDRLPVQVNAETPFYWLDFLSFNCLYLFESLTQVDCTPLGWMNVLMLYVTMKVQLFLQKKKKKKKKK
jgi:hypothetical protein